jgi:hypothetical protein
MTVNSIVIKSPGDVEAPDLSNDARDDFYFVEWRVAKNDAID